MGLGETQDEKVGYQCASQENFGCLARLKVWQIPVASFPFSVVLSSFWLQFNICRPQEAWLGCFLLRKWHVWETQADSPLSLPAGCPSWLCSGPLVPTSLVWAHLSPGDMQTARSMSWRGREPAVGCEESPWPRRPWENERKGLHLF